MILPGRVFYKKYHWPKFNLATVIVVLCAFLYLFLSINQPDQTEFVINRLKAEDHWKIENMYRQSLDPILLSREVSPISADLKNAFKDQSFWMRSQNYVFTGNAAELAEYKKFLYDFNAEYENSAAYQFGLSSDATTPMAWITYQFVHTHFMHLLMNMLFLYLIVAQLERRIRSEWIIAVFLFSGFGAGIFYLIAAEDSALAMIGASGSISGLMAFTSIIFYDIRIKWSYFLTPLKGAYGTIYLPAYFIFFVFLVTDFTRTLGSNDGVQASVAHSAHVGGALVGVFLGFFYLFDRWFKSYLVEKWGPALGPQELRKLRD